jgi:hypothetical protein
MWPDSRRLTCPFDGSAHDAGTWDEIQSMADFGEPTEDGYMTVRRAKMAHSAALDAKGRPLEYHTIGGPAVMLVRLAWPRIQQFITPTNPIWTTTATWPSWPGIPVEKSAPATRPPRVPAFGEPIFDHRAKWIRGYACRKRHARACWLGRFDQWRGTSVCLPRTPPGPEGVRIWLGGRAAPGQGANARYEHQAARHRRDPLLTGGRNAGSGLPSRSVLS